MTQTQHNAIQQAQENQQLPGSDPPDGSENGQNGDEDQNKDSLPLVSPEISKICTTFTQCFHAGELPKSTAILFICDALSKRGIDPKDKFLILAFGSYVAILDGFERFHNTAASHGGGPAEDRENGIPPKNGDPGDTQDPYLLEGGPPSPSPLSKQAQSPLLDDGCSSSHHQINTSVLPWVVQEEETPTLLSPSLQRTQVALENFS
jgi:hypothetical protein